MKNLIRSSSLIIGLFFSCFSAAITIKSENIKNGQKIEDKYVFNGFGCSGKNISPNLSWSNFPKETKYFAVTVYDPDAPTGSGWWHWLVINIPSDITSLKSGASGNADLMPEGSIETRTDFGKSGYGGPCTPEGRKPHRYIFKVFALKDKVPLEVDASGAMVGFYLNSLKIGKEGELTAYYNR